jgi:hypothetical protein
VCQFLSGYFTSSNVSFSLKKLEIQIKQSIETTAVVQAMRQEPKPLKMIKSTPAVANKKNIKSKGGKGKK